MNPEAGRLATLACVVAWTLCASSTSRAQSTRSKCSIPFAGTASGGTLILAGTLNRNASAVSLETARGEAAESVARRLAQVLNEEPLWTTSPGARIAGSAGAALVGLPGNISHYMIAGTESGLGIPPPPTSLTCSYDEPSKVLRLRWKNPLPGYDSLRLIWNWHKYDHRGETAFAGNTESYTLDLHEPPADMAADLDIWLVGLRKGIPSNAAAMHVSNSVQEELFGIPFANETAPNWTAWSLGGPDATKPEMVTRTTWVPKPKRLYDPVTSAERKPYQQIIRVTGEGGGTGGVSRAFLGLFPGHTYRVTVRLSTMSSALKDNPDWSYSFHAVACGPGKSNLTVRQMAGLDALPDGGAGGAAGRLCLYDAHKTTRGRYDECVKEVTVPQGADSITVWLRFTSRTKGDAVAMDSIKFEDLGEQ